MHVEHVEEVLGWMAENGGRVSAMTFWPNVGALSCRVARQDSLLRELEHSPYTRDSGMFVELTDEGRRRFGQRHQRSEDTQPPVEPVPPEPIESRPVCHGCGWPLHYNPRTERYVCRMCALERSY